MLKRVRKLGRRPIAAAAAIAVVAVAIGALIASAAPGSSQGAKSPSAAAGSTSVERRNLVATDTESGTLSFANPQTVFGRLSGTITWLPVLGQVIEPGHTLYQVDNQPVVLFNGSTPAFRDLSAADAAGPDILELNRELVRLGFDNGDPITVNDTWQAATTDAVDRWQGSLGESETGTITLGQVVFLPGAQRVTAVDAALGSTGGSGASAAAASGTSASTNVVAAPEFVSLTKTTRVSAPPRRPKAPVSQQAGSSAAAMLAEIKALEALVRAETQELRVQRSSASSAGAKSGGGSSRAAASAGSAVAPAGSAGSSAGSGVASSGGANAQAIMQTSSTQLVVTVDLDASKQSEAVLGAPVTVQMPDGSNVNGKITGVSPVAQSSSSSSSGGSGSGSGGGSSSGSGGSGGSSATVPVTIALPAHHSTTGLDQAAVSVSFEQQVENNVLSVPVTALLATQGGGYAVQEAAAPHRMLAVTPGLFAAGYVQISGSGIYPGLQVTDSQG